MTAHGAVKANNSWFGAIEAANDSSLDSEA
jgi:hypothetical protein